MQTPQNQMITVEQAFNNVVLACSKFIGTKEDHTLLEISLNILKKVVEESLPKAKEKKDDTLKEV